VAVMAEAEGPGGAGGAGQAAPMVREEEREEREREKREREREGGRSRKTDGKEEGRGDRWQPVPYPVPMYPTLYPWVEATDGSNTSVGHRQFNGSMSSVCGG